MNLQDQGYRFILREKDGRVDGHWEHPATMRPGGYDATDLSDEAMSAAIYDLQDGYDPSQPRPWPHDDHDWQG